MTKRRAAKKKGTEIPQAVWQAMAQQGLHPEELKTWQVTEDDVLLSLQNGMQLRVERSSLLERFTTDLQPGSGSVTAAQRKAANKQT